MSDRTTDARKVRVRQTQPEMGREALDLLRLQERSLSLLARGAELKELLDHLLSSTENLIPRSAAAVIMFDASGGVHDVFAGPGLNEQGIADLRELPVLDGLASRTRVAHLCGPVVVGDALAGEQRFGDLAAICRQLGFRGSWSSLLFSDAGVPLGAFLLLSESPGAPNTQAQQVLATTSNGVGIALQAAGTRRERDEQRALFDSFMRATRTLVLLVDLGGRISLVNAACESRTGISAVDLVGREFYNTPLISREREFCAELLQRTISDRRILFFETTVEVRQSAPLRISWCFAPQLDANGEVSGVICAGMDVTGLRAAEEQKVRLERELIEAQRMEAVGALTSGIAHDFNNMLMAILGYSDLARFDLAQVHPARAALESLDRAAHQAAGISKALLAFSRQGAHEREAVDLRELFASTTGMLRRIFPKSIDVIEECIGDEPFQVWGDDGQLRQVLVNLAVNGRESMRDGGELRCRLRFCGRGARDVRAPRGEVVIEVTDSGHGMTNEVMARIFEPSFTTKGRSGGTGLGLSVLRDIVRDHGGWVDVESTIGNGSTFSVHLPRWTNAVDATHVNGMSTPGCGELVLIAEDDPLVGTILRTGLTKAGYDVRVFDNGAEFVAAATPLTGEVRHLVVDLDLPGMGGLECLRTLRASGVLCPALLMSAWPDLDPAVVRKLQGEVFRKPFRLQELTARIASNLARCSNDRHSQDPAR